MWVVFEKRVVKGIFDRKIEGGQKYLHVVFY
jgi:hypothetical protein